MIMEERFHLRSLSLVRENLCERAAALEEFGPVNVGIDFLTLYVAALYWLIILKTTTPFYLFVWSALVESQNHPL
jgi:hypothetical protein